MKNKNETLFCPMKFAMSPCTDYTCDVEKCAWHCQYSNGEGECAIHSLPGLFDGLDSIATQIATK